MNKNNNSITFLVIRYICLALVMLGFGPTSAAELYTIEPYIDFSTQGIKQTKWLPPIANSTSNNELFFINADGEIYRSVGQKIENLPILNLSEQIQTQNKVTFTALTLHPSFHLLDQTGTNIIYSAHIEAYDPSLKNIRLTDNNIEEKHTHDAVIVEWQLSNINNNQINVASQREVLRIASTSLETHIKQLSFNPYLKPWSDDFGLLYILFNNDEQFKDSTLFSGSVLRIKPEKFGLKNYTIPRNNPFIKSSTVADEVIIVGAQNTTQLTWSKQTKNQLILTHEYDNEQLISLTPIGSNYLQTKPLNIIYKRSVKDTPLSTAYYKSRELTTLWNKIVFLDKDDKQWKMNATKIKNTLNETLDNNPNYKTALELSPDNINVSNKLSLYIPRENELLLWDQSQNIVFKVLPSLLINNKATTPETSNEKGSISYLVYVLTALIFIIAILLFIKIQYNHNFIKTKSLLRASLARFSFDSKTNEVSLFRRHEKAVDTVLPTKEITSSEILLNDTLINTVTSGTGNSFNEQQENALRLSFEQEHRDKMVDDKVRKITLKLNTTKSDKYIICVYLREGNQRLTKEKYYDVIDHLIDWCWYFSSKINKAETPERVLKQEPALKNQIPAKTAKKKQESKPTSNIVNDKQLNTEKVEKSSPDLTASPTKKTSSAKVDTNLVDALNKLVSLKEQGYLTEEEFALAKENLLESLSNEQQS